MLWAKAAEGLPFHYYQRCTKDIFNSERILHMVARSLMRNSFACDFF